MMVLKDGCAEVLVEYVPGNTVGTIEVKAANIGKATAQYHGIGVQDIDDPCESATETGQITVQRGCSNRIAGRRPVSDLDCVQTGFTAFSGVVSDQPRTR